VGFAVYFSSDRREGFIRPRFVNTLPPLSSHGGPLWARSRHARLYARVAMGGYPIANVLDAAEACDDADALTCLYRLQLDRMREYLIPNFSPGMELLQFTSNACSLATHHCHWLGIDFASRPSLSASSQTFVPRRKSTPRSASPVANRDGRTQSRL